MRARLFPRSEKTIRSLALYRGSQVSCRGNYAFKANIMIPI